MVIGELEVRPSEGLVVAGGAAVGLTVREFGLLTALAERVGHVVSRADLYERVWGGPLRAGDRTVDVYVHKLRAKLEQALPDREVIHTHVGFGYRLIADRSHDVHTVLTSPSQDAVRQMIPVSNHQGVGQPS